MPLEQQPSDTEIVRRTARITHQVLSQRDIITSLHPLDLWEGLLRPLREQLQNGGLDKDPLILQTFNTYLIGFFQGALSIEKMSLNRKQRQQLQEMLDMFKDKDCSTIEKS